MEKLGVVWFAFLSGVVLIEAVDNFRMGNKRMGYFGILLSIGSMIWAFV